MLGEAAGALARYRDTYGVYPWLSSFHDPRSTVPGPVPLSFKSDLSRAGLLPVHLEDEIFATRFAVSWRFVDGSPTTWTWHSGDARLVPPLSDGMIGTARVSPHSGRCRWSDPTRGDCFGTETVVEYYRADLARAVRRTVEVNFGVADPTPTVHPPTPADVRRRTLSLIGPRLPATAWNVRITDDDGIARGTREIAIDSDTAGGITLSGIRYDLSVVFDDVADARDELPEWFVDNEWHHHIHAAFSADAVAGGNADGDDDCTTPVDNCLSIGAPGGSAPRPVRGLVIAPGVPLSHQDRSIGDCDGDGLAEDYLCAYLEGDNSDKSTPARADVYSGGSFTALFNDQVRVVDPAVR